jgi:hypothetical protein
MMAEYGDNNQEQAVEIALLRRDLESLQTDVKELNKEIKSLVSAWNTATGLVAFVKYAAAAVTAIGVIWFTFKEFFQR